MGTTATAWPWAADMPEAAAAPPAGEGSILSKFGSGRTPDGTRLIRAFGLSRIEVAQLAAMDFPNPDLPFRRVSIDPVRGVAVMMAPSRLHERIAVRLDKLAEGLGGGVQGGGLRVEQLRGTRWRDREGPQGAGAEADCAFYVGETGQKPTSRAEASGDEPADAFTDRHPPDLVVETSPTPTRASRPGIGVWVSRSFGRSLPASHRTGLRSNSWTCKPRAVPRQAGNPGSSPERSRPMSRMGCECSRMLQYR